MRGTPFAQRALEHVNLAVGPQSAHGLIGATGAGKSTLLQHLNALLRPQEGTVRVDGLIFRGGERAAADDISAMRHMVGLVFQMPETQIFEQYVGDEIAYGPRLAGLDGEALRERVRWAMGLVGLDFEGFKDRLTFALSGGEKRKVALASILALRPAVLLLDEPTAGLDPASRHELLAQLRRFGQEGDGHAMPHPDGGAGAPETRLAHLQCRQAPCQAAGARQAAGAMTLVLSSHQMEDIAALCDHVTVMLEGTTVSGGSAPEVFSQRERLQEWGLEQPIATQVAEALIARGWPLPAGIVDEDRLIDALLGCLDA